MQSNETLRTRLPSIVFDCRHPAALAAFWAQALACTVRAYSREEIDRLRANGLDPESDTSVVIDPRGPGPTTRFNLVPETKVAKNRVHIDVDLSRFTVELTGEDELREAVLAGSRMGLPVVEGEWAHDGSYHYYPGIDQVHAWLAETGFETIEEQVGDGYHHFLVRRS